MNEGYIQVFCGEGNGKTSAAIGKGLLSAIAGQKVIIIQFLKERNENETKFFGRMEPEIKLFRFEKSETCFSDLSKEEKADEVTNLRNGLNFAKKVLVTGECDMLILDEILGLIDEGIIEYTELLNILEAKSDEMTILMTGIVLPEQLRDKVDYVSKIVNV